MIVMSIRELTKNHGSIISRDAKEIVQNLEQGKRVIVPLGYAIKIADCHRADGNLGEYKK